ncbi:MAG: cupin domain-containing protein [Bacteroidota bacterium]
MIFLLFRRTSHPLSSGLIAGLMCLSLTAIAQITDHPSGQLDPILLDKSALSGLGLERIHLRNEPDRDFFERVLYRGESLSVYIISSQSWTGSMENFFIDEYVHIFHGKSRARPVDGKDLFFQTGDHFSIPKGFTGEWEVMAGDNYHYELSVFTTHRVPTPKLSLMQSPLLFDKDKLSGLEIRWGDDEEGLYEDIMFKGDELTIFLRAEKARSMELIQPAKEQLISVLSGQLTLQSTTGEAHTFFSGDIFIIPKGMTGSWTSQGHSLLKYLAIEKTD